MSGLGVILKQLQGDYSEESDETDLTEVEEKSAAPERKTEDDEMLQNTSVVTIPCLRLELLSNWAKKTFGMFVHSRLVHTALTCCT